MPSGGGFAFGPFLLGTGRRELLRTGEPVALSLRQFVVLHELVRQAGDVVSKEQLIAVGWDGRAISDSSVEKLLSDLRTVRDRHNRSAYIVNFARRGYRFVAPVTVVVPEVDIDALLAPSRAWIEGRAALESLERARIAPHARRSNS